MLPAGFQRTKAEHPKIYQSFQRTEEEEEEKGQRLASPPGGTA
jgi:hypothetical protein